MRDQYIVVTVCDMDLSKKKSLFVAVKKVKILISHLIMSCLYASPKLY